MTSIFQLLELKNLNFLSSWLREMVSDLMRNTLVRKRWLSNQRDLFLFCKHVTKPSIQKKLSKQSRNDDGNCIMIIMFWNKQIFMRYVIIWDSTYLHLSGKCAKTMKKYIFLLNINYIQITVSNTTCVKINKIALIKI